MKKIIYTLWLLVVLLLGICNQAEAATFYYEIKEDGTATLTDVKDATGTLTIPEVVGGNYTVTTIGTEFTYNNEGITEVVIPKTVVRIFPRAFGGTTNLKKVTFTGDGLEFIGSSAFSNSGIESFVFPKTVTNVQQYAFSGSSLKMIHLPAHVSTWGDAVFQRSNLAAVSFDEGITTIPGDMFSNCTNLSQITWPASLTQIGDRAFEYCDGLSELTLPVTLTYVGFQAFKNVNLDKLIIECSDDALSYGWHSGKVKELHCRKYSSEYDSYKELINDGEVKFVPIGPYISSQSITLKEGNTKKLMIKNGSDQTQWTSSNSKVAKVSQKGVVTAVKKGSATITAVNNGITMTCKVTVNALKLSKKENVTVGKTIKLKLSGGKKIKWSSSNKGIATVNSKGVVKGKKIGKTTITAKCNGKKYKCKVSVKPNSIKLKEVHTSDYFDGMISIDFTNVTAVGNTYQVTGVIVNKKSQRVSKIIQTQVTLKHNGKVIAKQWFKNIYVSAHPGSYDEFTITFDKGSVKKKNVDLRSGSVQCESERTFVSY